MSKKTNLPFKSIKKTTYAIILVCVLGIPIALAAVLDYFGPPPPDDPSAYGPLSFSEELLSTTPANEGAFEGGATGTYVDAGVNNSVPEDELVLLADFDVPTGGQASPLFGAVDFTQQMLRFEEFGMEQLPASATIGDPFPVPTIGSLPEQDPLSVAASGPAGTALEAFLDQPGIAPFPTEFANDIDENPWKLEIQDYLGRDLLTPPAEGRPPGRAWAHQRWNEFHPEVFFKTAQAGARVNGGFRDGKQLHGYSMGEFGPGGLYHNTAGIPETEGTTNGLTIRFHPNMPIQDHKTLWTFDGTLPPKLLMARYGQSILMRHYNALPIDPSANRGFGLHTISTHEHNGHNPAESDGYTNAFFFPGQYYDYRWPMTLAGYDTVNTTATDPRAAFPCTPGETLFVNDIGMDTKTCENGTINIRGDWKETMSTHWFHDHMLDFTAQNVYKGNAAMMNYYSALDRGNEEIDDGVNLRFPSGTALDWGNRDYDINLLIADKAWDQEGQLWFNIFNLDGFIGDRVLTNWLYKPYFDVRARSYRFRILNGAVARYFAFALVQQVTNPSGEIPGPPGSSISYNRVPFHLIANDGNILEHTVPFDGSVDLDNDGILLDHKGQLPTQGIAERYDIIVDFSKHGIQPGDKLYLINVLEHTEGKTTGDKIPLEEILSGQYAPVISAGHWVNGDPAVGKIMELRVTPYDGVDLSMNPDDYLPGGQKMIPLPIDRNDPQLANALHRTFEFGSSNATDERPWTIKTDGGSGFAMDPRRVTSAPQLATGPTMAGFDGTNAEGSDAFGTIEIWRIENSSGASHPVHIHFEEGVILKRNNLDPPEWERWARKDLYRIGREEDSGDSVEVALRFREFAGTYMEHCHNTQHEDNAMLMRWDLEHPGQVELMATPIPTWDGVEYVDSAALPTFRTGDGVGPTPIPPATGVTLTSDIASPQIAGVASDVTFTAVGSGGIDTFEYQFYLRTEGVWSVVQPYSSINTWTWPASSAPAGDYAVSVYVRSADTTVKLDVLAVNAYSLTPLAETNVTLTPSIASPQTAGSTADVTFTAVGAGGTGTFEYQFFLRTNGVWSVVQPYSSLNTWTWPASTATAGEYTVSVYVRAAGSSVNLDALAVENYTLAPLAATGVSLTPSIASPQTAGSAPDVTFTAIGAGGTGTFEYQFYLRTDGVWSVVQPYSSLNTWTWPVSTAIAGEYAISVYVRTVGSSARLDALAVENYTLTPLAATGAILTPSIVSPQTAGSTSDVTFTAIGEGGTGTFEYQFYLRTDGIWSVTQPYSSLNTWTWPASSATAGDYAISVYVRSAGSTSNIEALDVERYTLIP